MMTAWDQGCFVRVNSRRSEHFIAKDSGSFSSATIRRHQDDNAHDTGIVQEVKTSYRDYVVEGSVSVPVGVRTHAPALSNPDPGAVPVVPRRARLKPEDFLAHGYKVGCPGCEQFHFKSEIWRDHTDPCRFRME